MILGVSFLDHDNVSNPEEIYAYSRLLAKAKGILCSVRPRFIFP
jgi:hypothetical protein